LKDTFKHKGLRQKLVEVIKSKGIVDEKVLDAIGKIPRHLFMDSSFLDHDYQDKPFPIAADQTISQPYTVAFQTELLEVKKGDKILFGKWSGTEVKMNGEDYLIMKESDIMGIITSSKKKKK